jgi:hypothetical protein
VRCRAKEATHGGSARGRGGVSAHAHALHAKAEAASGASAAWPGRGAGNLVLLQLSEQEVAGCLAVSTTR